MKKGVFFARRGFTLLELLIVIVILGVFARLSMQTYLEFTQRAKYETFISSIEGFTKKARNMSLVNEAKYDSATGTYTSPKGHGVVIQKLNTNSMTVSLFERNLDALPLTDTVLETASLSNTLSVEEFSAIKAESNTPSSAFSKLTLYFAPDPNPQETITSEVPENIRSFILKLAFLDNKGKTYLKKISGDSVSKSTMVSDYPLIIDAVRVSNTLLTFTANAQLQPLADITPYVSAFHVSQNSTSYPVQSGSISGSTISLIFSSSLPSSGSNLNIVFDGVSSIISTDGIQLRPINYSLPL